MSGRTVLVTGMGLMGGSLAGALSQAGWRVLVHHRRPEVAQEAARRGWGEAVGDLKAAAGVDLAVVCTPLSAIAEQVRQLARAGARLITDVGSTKAGLVAQLADLSHCFVGSHPMAGSHLTGLAHADPQLYRDRLAILTPTGRSPEAAVAAVSALWRSVGCRVSILDPAVHDRVVAQASHLPHVLASAGAAQLSAEAAPFAATGFRDSTRIAAGAAGLWAEILLENASAIDAALDMTISHLLGLRAALMRGDQAAVESWLRQGNAGRQRFEGCQPP